MSAYDDLRAIREIAKQCWIYLGSSRKLQIILAPTGRGNGIYIPAGIHGAEWNYLDNAGQEIRDYLRPSLEPGNVGVEFLIGSQVQEPSYATVPNPPPQNPPPPPRIIPPNELHPPTTPITPNQKIYCV